jgi:hypothetical protein
MYGQQLKWRMINAADAGSGPWGYHYPAIQLCSKVEFKCKNGLNSRFQSICDTSKASLITKRCTAEALGDSFHVKCLDKRTTVVRRDSDLRAKNKDGVIKGAKDENRGSLGCLCLWSDYLLLRRYSPTLLSCSWCASLTLVPRLFKNWLYNGGTALREKRVLDATSVMPEMPNQALIFVINWGSRASYGTASCQWLWECAEI